MRDVERPDYWLHAMSRRRDHAARIEAWRKVVELALVVLATPLGTIVAYTSPDDEANWNVHILDAHFVDINFSTGGRRFSPSMSWCSTVRENFYLTHPGLNFDNQAKEVMELVRAMLLVMDLPEALKLALQNAELVSLLQSNFK